MQFEGQYEDEKVLFFFRTHPIVLRRPLLAFLLVFTVSIVPLAFNPFSTLSIYIAIGGFLLGALILFYFWISWYFTLYIVTDVRIIQDIQKGIFGKQVVEIDLDKVQNVNYEVDGFQAAVFKFGTIVVQTFVGDLVIEKVHKPAEIQKELSSILRTHAGDSKLGVPLQ